MTYIWVLHNYRTNGFSREVMKARDLVHMLWKTRNSSRSSLKSDNLHKSFCSAGSHPLPLMPIIGAARKAPASSVWQVRDAVGPASTVTDRGNILSYRSAVISAFIKPSLGKLKASGLERCMRTSYSSPVISTAIFIKSQVVFQVLSRCFSFCFYFLISVVSSIPLFVRKDYPATPTTGNRLSF